MIAMLAVVLALAVTYAITLTPDATARVDIPQAALGSICLWDETSGACTDETGEVLFGNANVYNRVGGVSGMILIQLAGRVYRSTTMHAVFLYNVTTTDGENFLTTDLSGIRNIETSSRVSLVGFKGKLSAVLPDGEVYSIGGTRTVDRSIEDIPPGDFYITYDNLVMERDIMIAGEYQDLVVTINLPDGSRRTYHLTDIWRTTSFEWVLGDST